MRCIAACTRARACVHHLSCASHLLVRAHLQRREGRGHGLWGPPPGQDAGYEAPWLRRDGRGRQAREALPHGLGQAHDRGLQQHGGGGREASEGSGRGGSPHTCGRLPAMLSSAVVMAAVWLCCDDAALALAAAGGSGPTRPPPAGRPLRSPPTCCARPRGSAGAARWCRR